jgi:hypothetical protein
MYATGYVVPVDDLVNPVHLLREIQIVVWSKRLQTFPEVPIYRDWSESILGQQFAGV